VGKRKKYLSWHEALLERLAPPSQLIKTRQITKEEGSSKEKNGVSLVCSDFHPKTWKKYTGFYVDFENSS